MSLISDSDSKSAVNLSLSDQAIERLHYEAKHHRQKRAIVNGDFPVSPSIQYAGDELTDDEVELVERFVGWLLYDSIPRKFFREMGDGDKGSR
jgi:hypothetical protein